jgi:hypothetical protein
VANWVSANDKPTTGAGSKPITGDAAEQRLKTEVMQLPSRDRRRLKDISQNDVSYGIVHSPCGLAKLTQVASMTPLRHLLAFSVNRDSLNRQKPQIPRQLAPEDSVRQV